MRVYYFVKSRWAVECIRKQRLKICRFFEANDPFELLGGGLGDKDLRQKVMKWANTLNEQHGLLCFSSSWKNPLMWSHYGERHKGMCLGFDARDSILKRVKYEPKKVSLAKWKKDNATAPPNDLKEILFEKKHDAWKYESEQRVILPIEKLTKEGNLFYFPFGNNQELKLVEVFAGHRCCFEWKHLIEDAVKNWPSPVPKLIKARVAFNKFEVVVQRQGFDDSNAWQKCGDTCPKDHNRAYTSPSSQRND
jgi:hypothetical protein